MVLRYLYTISKLFCFDIEFRVLQYRYFFVGSSLGCLLGTGHRLQCAHCNANQQRRLLHSATQPHPLHQVQHRPQPPERSTAAGAAAAAAGAGIIRTQERVILGDKN
jgi:hypothetical protein